MKETENCVPRPSSFDGYVCDAVLKSRLQEHIAAAGV